MSAKANSSNPFDAHYNRIKKKVVGQKLTKSEHGQPGRARHQAYQKREKTLLQEYVRRDKAGKLADKRLDDQFGGSSRRKAKLFERQMRSSEILSLTHAGKVLDEKLDDKPEVDFLEEADDDLNLLRRADYVESVHFGGGDGNRDIGDDQDGVVRSQAEFMKLMMSEKIKRQEEMMQSKELTQQLDLEFANLRSLISSGTAKVDEGKDKSTAEGTLLQKPVSSTTEADKIDKLYSDYDFLARSLITAKKQAKEESKGITRAVIEEKKAKKQASREERNEAINRLEEEGIQILPLVPPRIEPLRSKATLTQRLKKKVKRETKAAARELRKDSSFLKSVWLQETLKRDNERKDKVKRILADISSDIHDCRRIKKAA